MSGKFAMANLTAGELNALVKNVGGAEAARRINRGELEVRERDKPSLLKPVGGHVTISGSDTFCAAEWFKNGVHADGVHIYGTNDNFREHFLGKTEENVPEITLVAHELTKYSRDPAIITALGGEERAELKLAHVRELMRRTQAGEETLVQSGVNIFYVRDEGGALWAGNFFWDVGNRVWDVYVCSVKDPCLWDRGERVLSRDS